MLNNTVQPVMYNNQPPVQNIQPQSPVQSSAPQQPDQKTVLKEQSMAISSDIAAEYGAVTRLNDILVELAKTIKENKDPEQKKILEARVNTINQMILQREMKINQMEMTRAQIDNQLKQLA